MDDEHGAAFTPRLLTYYGRLVAELEEATNPSHPAWPQARLDELDTTLAARHPPCASVAEGGGP